MVLYRNAHSRECLSLDPILSLSCGKEVRERLFGDSSGQNAKPKLPLLSSVDGVLHCRWPTSSQLAEFKEQAWEIVRFSPWSELDLGNIHLWVEGLLRAHAARCNTSSQHDDASFLMFVGQRQPCPSRLCTGSLARAFELLLLPLSEIPPQFSRIRGLPLLLSIYWYCWPSGAA